MSAGAAARALREAGQRFLGESGLQHRRSSPRQWWLDKGWWLVNVEFQPSGWSVGSYVNVGLQHLWIAAEHRFFEYGLRVPVDGVPFVGLEVTGPELQEAADAVAKAARRAVQRWVEDLADDDRHLRWLRAKGGTGWAGLNAAIAAQLLDGDAAADLHAIAAELDPSIDWQRALADECRRLAASSAEPIRFRDAVAERIRATRANLGLPDAGSLVPHQEGG